MNRYGKICIITSVHSAFDVRIFHKQAQPSVGAGYHATLTAKSDGNETIIA